MQQTDPFRENARSATDADLTELVEQGPVSRDLGLRSMFEEGQVTDRTGGFIVSDDRRAFDAQRARVFGEQYGNMLSAEQANAEFGLDAYLTFDGPVNRHRAVEMRRQAELRRFREETAARADLSALDTLGASLLGGMTDPVLLPTWFIGGGSAAVRALGVAGRGTRAANMARGAAVGVIDGITGGVAAEAINAGARLSTGEDYGGDDALRNILFGAAFGGVVGGGVGAAQRPHVAGPVGAVIEREARAAGVDVGTAMRIAQIESGGDPRAQNRRSSAGGLFQFIDSTWARFGGGDKYDPTTNARAMMRLTRENTAGLTETLGRPPEGWEIYLAHQQGLGGARELLRDPSRPAEAALRAAGVRNPGRALTLNGGRAGMTAGEFAGLWRGRFGDAGPSLESLIPPPTPAALRGLTENERIGGFVEAMEAVAEDTSLDLGPLLARNGLDALDETTAVPTIRGRWLEADTAVTRSGGEVPVRFAVVELADLRTSHTDDLTPDGAYPTALQPRDRARPGAQAENYNLERDLNPALLMRDKAASGGAPVVSPDGLVESDNGRAIALRRSAATGTPAWGRYQAELARQGIDTTGFDRPVLVRMRTEPMTGAGRAEMAREMNQSQVEAYSPVEQARADARRLDADTLSLIEGDDAFSAANRPFLRGFVARVAPNDANALTDARGAISAAGRTRVQAALVQRAYGDDALTAALFETADPNIRPIGQALAEAAPAWARMRAEAPGALDVTGNLTGAVALIREARMQGVRLIELLEERLGQTDLLGAETLSPETGAFVRLMFRDDALTKPRAVERIAGALQDYARSAAATPAGPDLFGETPDGRAILDTLIARYAGAEGEGRSGLSYAGGSEPLFTTREAETAGLDLHPAGGDGPDAGGGGERPADGGTADGTGDGGLTARRSANPIVFEGGNAGRSSADTEMAARYEAMSREEKLTWHADSEIRSARSSITRMETDGPSAFMPADRIPQAIADYLARIGHLETLRAAGRLGDDPSLRALADARPVGEARAGDVVARLKAAGIEGVTVAPSQGHGPVLTGLEGRWTETVTALKALKDGDVPAALHHPAIGAIDMVWGKEATTPQKSDGWGLAKLLQKHPEVIDDLPERLARMEITQVLPDRINLASEADRAAVRLDWNQEAKTWLVTAFAKDGKGGRGGAGSSVSDALDGPAPSPNPSAEPNIGRAGENSEGRPTPEARVAAFIAADPELKALVEDTEALARAAGIEVEPSTGRDDPSTIAEAIRAAAYCLTSDFVA